MGPHPDAPLATLNGWQGKGYKLGPMFRALIDQALVRLLPPTCVLCGAPGAAGLDLRLRVITPQKGLDKEARRRNMRGAFGGPGTPQGAPYCHPE